MLKCGTVCQMYHVLATLIVNLLTLYVLVSFQLYSIYLSLSVTVTVTV